MSTEKRGDTFVMKESEPGTEVDFNTFVLGLASTALIHLGQTPHPETGKPEKDLILARQSIEMLSLLKQKTRGNLSAEEERFFDSILADLRIRFVEAGKR
jgi:hypothetical protein